MTIAKEWLTRAQQAELKVENFIAGKREAPAEGELIIKRSPRDGAELVRFHASGASDVERAVVSARTAFRDGRWSRLSLGKRREVLLRFVALLEARREELALLESLDVGKPISDAFNFDVPMAAAIIRYNAELADKVFSKMYSADGTGFTYQLRRPIGVIGAIVGWNFPLALAAQKIGPALAAGNSLVLKPSEATSLSAWRVAELAVEAGLPEGVFNVVNGAAAAGDALARHDDVNLLTFTGSSSTGKKLMVAAGQSNMKRLVLECGGKAPNIVFDDAPDLDAVADAIVARAFWNRGQVCTASSRVLMQSGIKRSLLQRVVERTSQLKLGDPLDPNTRHGALVNAEHQAKVSGYVESGKQEGAAIVFRGDDKPPLEGGSYAPCTIFDDVRVGQKIAQEEIFGPVLSVMSFETEEEAASIANSTMYGLSATVWTTNIGRAHRLTQAIEAGSIVVNATPTPAGGPAMGATGKGGHKQSGLGVEGGVEGFEALTSSAVVQYCV